MGEPDESRSFNAGKGACETAVVVEFCKSSCECCMHDWLHAVDKNKYIALRSRRRVRSRAIFTSMKDFQLISTWHWVRGCMCGCTLARARGSYR